MKWSLLSVAVSAVTGVAAARALEPSGRGLLALILSLAGICVLVGAMGTNVAIRVHLPKSDDVGIRSFLVVSVRLLLAVAITLVGLVLCAYRWIDPAFGSWSIALGFVVFGIASFVSNQALDLLNARGMVQRSAMLNALGSILTMLLVLAALFIGLGLVAVIAAYVAGPLVQGLVGLAWSADALAADESPPAARSLLRTGVRLMGFNLGQSLAYSSGPVILAAIAGSREVGIYAVAVTPASLARVPANALGQVNFYRASSGVLTLRRLRRELAVVMVSLSAMVVAGLIVAEPLVTTVFGSAYADSVVVFRLLLLAELALVPFLIIARVLAGLGLPRAASTCGTCGVPVLCVGCILLVPSYGAAGAAGASIAAYAAMSMLAVWMVCKYRARLSQVN
ncbi:oligosaccharide flippase family protein [Aeromicrobium sp. CF3.5]|uniref:oligosaccharide flippase family protein n=1 Tax=Aeromicrobium sp. CF3.5 TaxID=3373078 RepID=UPI003EE4CA38